MKKTLSAAHKKRRRAYRQQRETSHQRGIQWEMTYISWILVWARSGHWHERGRSRGKYVMSRPGDKGPYATGNVKIIMHSENVREGQMGNKNGLGNKNMLGKKHSAETRAKMSVSKMGNKLWLGKRHSAQTRAKMSVAQKIRWAKRTTEKE